MQIRKWKQSLFDKKCILLLSNTFYFLVFLYLASFLLQISGKNISLSLLAYRCIGVSMLASIIGLLIFLKARMQMIVCWSLIGISVLLFSIDLFCFFVFKTPLSEAMLATVIETNFDEILSFIQLYFSLENIAKLIVAVVFLLFFARWFLHSCFIIGRGGGVIFCFLAFVGIFWWGNESLAFLRGGYSCQYRNSLIFITPLRDLCYLKNTIDTNALAKEYMQNYQNDFTKKQERVIAKNDIENIVLILGESLSKKHMQIYGYSRATTPILKQLSQTKNLIVFTDVLAPHAQTTLSLRKVLTFLNYENEGNIQKAYESGNLVSLFNLANYSTFWFSNQMDKNSGILGAIASFASSNHFVSRFKQSFDDVFFDGELLLSFDDEVKNNALSKKNFFVFHLMGSHASYGNRYPREFSAFEDSVFGGRQRTISRYDNSVFYNDYVVNEVFQRFAKSDSVVIYISDHGEELYESGDFVGHSDDRMSRTMVEIPMLIYVSDQFIQKHNALYLQLLSAKDKPYMSDDLIHTILDIAGIDALAFDKTRSLVNQSFDVNRKRIVGGMLGKNYDLELKK